MINWPDRRFIGALFLASSAASSSTNPRRWVVNGGNVDTTTPQGIAVFQQAVLQYAREAVTIHQYAGAQGMITWDIEGQQVGAVYYGAPDMISQIAPEMESIVNYNGVSMALCSAYFETFRDAGLKLGVCIRAHRLFKENGNWAQLRVSDSEAYLDIKNSIAYARSRWGCTLFYIDSNSTTSTDVFRQLAADFPDSLLAPEHANADMFRYTAQWNSFFHFGVTRTSSDIRAVVPTAFSLIGGVSSPTSTQRAQIVSGMQRGDIYMFNGWYFNPSIDELISMREEAKTAPQEPETFLTYGNIH